MPDTPEGPAFASIHLDLAKLRHYCLNEAHPQGKHKARVLRASLGLTAAHAEYLRDRILMALPHAELLESRADRFGRRFACDLEIRTNSGRATLRTAWIVRPNDDVLRFVTCYVV